MKILVISDSHGNLKSLEHVLNFARRVNLEAVIHCGDWGSKEAAQLVAGSGAPLYAVLGNADSDPAIAANLKGANIHFDKDFLEFELDRRIGVCHFPPARRSLGEGGGKLKITNALPSGKYDILFHGHTHRKKDKMHGKTRVVNPGALSRTDNPSFAVYDTKNNSVEFIDLAV